MKRASVLASAAVGSLALAACQSGGSDEVTFRAGHGNTTDYIYSIALNEFADSLDELTDGRIEIDEYPGGQLGDETALLGLYGADDIDFSFALSSNAVPVFPELGMFDALFLFDDEDHYRAFAESEELYDILNGYLEDRGLQFEAACVSLSGIRSVYTDGGEVESVDDLRGLQVRVPPSPVAGQMWEELGASPTTLPWPDVYNGFSTGLVDAAENGPTSYFDGQHHEVASDFTDTRHQFAPAIMFVGTSTLEQIPEDLQDEFDEALETMCSWWLDEAFDSEAAALERIEEEGNSVYEPSDEFIEEMRQTVEPLTAQVVSDTGTDELYELIESTR